MRAFVLLVPLLGCATTMEVTRTVAAPVRPTDSTLAVAASGPYASELLASTRAMLEGAVKVESCVLGCPAVGLYASLSLTPGPHEGRTRRTCQAEVYTGKSWDCLRALQRWLRAPRVERLRVRLDDTGPLVEPVRLVRGGAVAEAKAWLEAAVAQPSASAGAWFNLGVLHETQGRRDDARRCYLKARSLGPPAWMKAAIDDFVASAD
jgi:Flp pilus assembly protein TadD